MYFGLVFAFILLLIFLAGAGFAVYGIVCFIKKRNTAGGHTESSSDSPYPADVSVESTATLFAGPHKEVPVFMQEEEAAPADGSLPSAQFTPPSGRSSRPAGKSSFQPWQAASFRANVTSYKANIMDKLFVRCIVIAAITLGLLIPLVFVSEMVDERAERQREAIAGIADLWGRSQTVSGPVLVIPYEVWHLQTEKVTDDQGRITPVSRKIQSTEYKVVLPSKVIFGAVITPQTRQRGIYDYVVYTSPITIQGKFRLPDTEAFDENLVRINWDKAWFSLGVTDLKINKVDNLRWNDAVCPPFSPGTQVKNMLGSGFHTRIPLVVKKNGAAEVAALPGSTHEFALSLTLNGSGGLHFTPVGETTEIDISGAWPHPSFTGDLLPVSRNVTDKDFTANWVIPHLSRTYPQVGDLDSHSFVSNRHSSEDDITGFTAGVRLYEMGSLYQQVDRSVKYGILFIGLTFVALLSFELVTRARLHFMQYGLVGIAMTLFYLVLLSLAEHTTFLYAFIAASFVSIAMNGLYITAALRSKNRGIIITALLAGLYAVLYALLQMEDYALIVGTALVMIVVGVLMYLTRHLPAGGSPSLAGVKE